MKFNGKTVRIAWGIIVLFAGFYMFTRPHLSCEEKMGQLYINGFLERKYKGERNTKAIEIKTTKGLSKISLFIYGDEFYKYLQPGDLIEKEIGSFEANVFRKGVKKTFNLCLPSECYQPLKYSPHY